MNYSPDTIGRVVFLETVERDRVPVFDVRRYWKFVTVLSAFAPSRVQTTSFSVLSWIV